MTLHCLARCIFPRVSRRSSWLRKLARARVASHYERYCNVFKVYRCCNHLKPLPGLCLWLAVHEREVFERLSLSLSSFFTSRSLLPSLVDLPGTRIFITSAGRDTLVYQTVHSFLRLPRESWVSIVRGNLRGTCVALEIVVDRNYIACRSLIVRRFLFMNKFVKLRSFWNHESLYFLLWTISYWVFLWALLKQGFLENGLL